MAQFPQKMKRRAIFNCAPLLCLASLHFLWNCDWIWHRFLIEPISHTSGYFRNLSTARLLSKLGRIEAEDSALRVEDLNEIVEE